MLNVKLVQDNVSERLLNLYRKYPNRNAFYPAMSYEDRRYMSFWDMATLPKTCSAGEFGSYNLHTNEDVANMIAKFLFHRYKYMQGATISDAVAKRLEKFGFKRIIKYQGNHGKKVSIYYMDLKNYKF